MKKFKVLFFPILLFILVISCEKSDKDVLWENAPVVATREMLGTGEFVNFNPELLKDTITFPLSYFVEDPVFVKLDNRDEALLSSQQSLFITDNYIFVLSRQNNPCKLFRKDGTFLTDIGAIGGGPGEYTRFSSFKIDEKNERIYILSDNSETIWVYDLTGKQLNPINLHRSVSYPYFNIEGDEVTVVAPPAKEAKTLIWKQTFQGEIIDSIPSAWLSGFEELYMPPMVRASTNTDAISLCFMTFPGRIDSLYHFDPVNMTLLPRFSIDYSNRELQAHKYNEWPDYFLGTTSEELIVTFYGDEKNVERKTFGAPALYYIIDKKTLKGAYINIVNDFTGGEKFRNPAGIFDNGYYSKNYDPGELSEEIVKILESGNIDDKRRQEFESLLESIDENDNNYIMYAKIK